MDNGTYCCFGGPSMRDRDLFHNMSLEGEDVEVVGATQALLYIYKIKAKEQREIYQILEKVRLNPNLMSKTREDLEYYIPQLVNYMVFTNKNDELIAFLYNASSEDFFFAHLVYFQLNSFSSTIAKTIQQVPAIVEFLSDFQRHMSETFESHYLVAAGRMLREGIISNALQLYGTGAYDRQDQIIRNQEIVLKQYVSIFTPNANPFNQSGFMSNIEFWNDLMTISQRLHLANPQIISLKADIQKINQRLPAAVYIPFVSDSIRNYIILNIAYNECRVFSTKERSPFYICLEIYRPDAELDQPPDDVKLSIAMTVQKGSHRVSVDNLKLAHKLSVVKAPLQIIDEAPEGPVTSSFYALEEGTSQYESFKHEEIEEEFLSENVRKSIVSGNEQSTLFGESSKEQKERIRKESPFGHFKSWRLVHLIVKSGDNLKQEQFAMQLLSTIQQIFIIEKVNITLVTYEVLSLGPDCGVIEMVKDAVTMDSLKRNLYASSESFTDFFNKNFDQQHRQNFMRSLVGYSLACYIMQLKDRHNGNILLRRDGCLVHIDFGFFLGNAPGKGIAIEQKVPFKMLTEYIEVLGGVESELFKSYRQLFFKGFKALRKHSDLIMLLVKMMYSGQGTNMPCFKKGDACLTQLQERFYLDEEDDSELNIICQNLINSSIDNWRARWYDKYQYYVQGIFY